MVSKGVRQCLTLLYVLDCKTNAATVTLRFEASMFVFLVPPILVLWSQK